MYVYICMYVCMHICVYAYIYVYIYACMGICVCMSSASKFFIEFLMTIECILCSVVNVYFVVVLYSPLPMIDDLI